MDIYDLKVSDRLWLLSGGMVAEVLAEAEDGQWVKVRYVVSPSDPALLDTEDLCHRDEIDASMSAARKQ